MLSSSLSGCINWSRLGDYYSSTSPGQIPLTAQLSIESDNSALAAGSPFAKAVFRDLREAKLFSSVDVASATPDLLLKLNVKGWGYSARDDMLFLMFPPMVFVYWFLVPFGVPTECGESSVDLTLEVYNARSGAFLFSTRGQSREYGCAGLYYEADAVDEPFQSAMETIKEELVYSSGAMLASVESSKAALLAAQQPPSTDSAQTGSDEAPKLRRIFVRYHGSAAEVSALEGAALHFSGPILELGGIEVAGKSDMDSVYAECRRELVVGVEVERECQLQSARRLFIEFLIQISATPLPSGEYELQMEVWKPDGNAMVFGKALTASATGIDAAARELLPKLACSYLKFNKLVESCE
ncbi:MAG: hypothetical protein RBU37_17720 [Myxococcota bacterium]|nr:hypothetical protein [Myxococcota bacterium]